MAVLTLALIIELAVVALMAVMTAVAIGLIVMTVLDKLND